MANPAARKGDSDDKGHSISNDCSPDVKINGVPAAVKGSTMDDGTPITSGYSTTVKINGKPAAVKGSQTDPHQQNPHRNEQGTINQGSDSVKIG